MDLISPTRAIAQGLGASALSLAALVWRGRKDAKSGSAPVNAISHWLWPEKALREDRPSFRYTGTGVAVHVAASMLWAALYEWRRRTRRKTDGGGGLAGVIADAAAVTAVAAVVDLRLTPERFTPGFERRLSTRSLVITYACFALGLAATQVWVRQRR